MISVRGAITDAAAAIGHLGNSLLLLLYLPRGELEFQFLEDVRRFGQSLSRSSSEGERGKQWWIRWFTEWASSVYWRERERGSGFLDTSSKAGFSPRSNGISRNGSSLHSSLERPFFFLRSSKSLLPSIVVNRELVRRALRHELLCVLLFSRFSMMNIYVYAFVCFNLCLGNLKNDF